MHLRQFVDGDGFLHVFRKTIDKPFKVKPENAFLITNLYTTHLIDGTKDSSAELFLAEQEGRASIILKKIIESARTMNPPNLSTEEKDTWDQYVCYQWKRIPHRILSDDDFDKIRPQAIRSIITKHGGIPTREDLESLHEPKLMQNVRVEYIIARSELLFERLNTRRLVVAVIRDSERSLVIGNNPIVPPPRFGDHNSTFWIALSPDVAISYERSPLLGPERLLPIRSGQHVREFNQATLDQSTEIAGRSRALVKSLAGNLLRPST